MTQGLKKPCRGDRFSIRTRSPDDATLAMMACAFAFSLIGLRRIISVFVFLQSECASDNALAMSIASIESKKDRSVFVREQVEVV